MGLNYKILNTMYKNTIALKHIDNSYELRQR